MASASNDWELLFMPAVSDEIRRLGAGDGSRAPRGTSCRFFCTADGETFVALRTQRDGPPAVYRGLPNGGLDPLEHGDPVRGDVLGRLGADGGWTAFAG